MPAIKLVTFDLDNTLWDVDTVVRKAEQRMRDWLSERIPDFNERFPPTALAEIRNAVLATEPALRHDLSRLREAVLFEAIGRCGYAEREARAQASAAFQVFYEARHEVAYFPGALETLANLAGRFRLAALTNGNANFTRLALDRYFSFGLSAADVGAGKPAPDMFHAALRQVGAAPGECIHVGDHLVDDIQGASAVGMHTIWVNLREHPLPEGAPTPSHTVQTLAEVPAGVSAIEGRG
jgi:putative hydrolase of the HAD superfamily